jgi:hypothetical protein
LAVMQRLLNVEGYTVLAYTYQIPLCELYVNESCSTGVPSVPFSTALIAAVFIREKGYRSAAIERRASSRKLTRRTVLAPYAVVDENEVAWTQRMTFMTTYISIPVLPIPFSFFAASLSNLSK